MVLTNASKAATDSKFPANLDQAAGSALSWQTLGLVDLAQHSISWLRNSGSRETGNETGPKVDNGVGRRTRSFLVDDTINRFGNLLINHEFCHRIRNP
jgi:hypothetical protein